MGEPRARVLCLSGLDPSGAAGLLRDHWAIQAAGGDGYGLPTCWTVQGRLRFAGSRPADADWLREALGLLADEERAAAVKLGFVDAVETWAELLPFLRGWRDEGIPVVVDPVRGPSAGGFEAGAELRACLVDAVLAQGPLLTPNLPELRWLAEGREGEEAAAFLLDRGARGVCVTGGHEAHEDDRTGEFVGELVDELWDARGLQRFDRERVQGERRGTGCVFSSLCALELGRGRSLGEAVERAGRGVAELWDGLAARPE